MSIFISTVRYFVIRKEKSHVFSFLYLSFRASQFYNIHV